MRNKLILLILGLVLMTGSGLAVPEMPHHVYGNITDVDGPTNDINVSFRYNGNTVESMLTDSNGYYDLQIPFDSNYEGSEINLFAEGSDTGKSITFEQGASDRLDHEGRNIIQESFSVSGSITKNSNAVNGVSVKFYNDGNSIASTTTDSNGDYSVDIGFSEGYDGETLNLYVNDSDTGQTTTFTTRGSATLDYSITDSDSSSSSSNDDSTNDEDNDDSGGGGGSSSSDDSTDDSDSDNEDTDQETDSSDQTSDQAEIEVTDVSSSPPNPDVGETVQIYVTLTNTGDSSTDHEVSIDIAGEELQETVEDFSAGSTELVTFETSFDSENTYSVSIGDETLDIDVSASNGSEESEEEQSDEDSGGGLGFIQIMGIVGGLLMVIVVVYLFIDSRGNSEIEEEQKGALDAFKEKKRKDKEDEDGFGWKYADDD